MRLKLAQLISLLFISIGVSAQYGTWPTDTIKAAVNTGDPKYPFPQFHGYANGTSLSKKNAEGVTDADMEKTMREAYQIMMHRCTYTGQSYKGKKYITYNNPTVPHNYNTFVSEGEGYVMIAAAYFADKEAFDGLWLWLHDNRFSGVNQYYNCKPLRAGYPYGRLPGWKNNENTPITDANPNGSAADGDFDIAMGLLIAHKQWGDNMGITDACGNQISYKEEALKMIKSLVDTVYYNKSVTGAQPGILGYMSGDIGVDGYVKSGNTWGEMTNWRVSATNTMYPWAKSIPDPITTPSTYVDYMAPAYFNQFAKFLQQNGGTKWQIEQFKRSEAASDWIMGEMYKKGYIASAGTYTVSANGATTTFGPFSDGEDFRLPWRTVLNYVWHGNPDSTWNPVTHQLIPGANTFERDMGVRHGNFMKFPGGSPTAPSATNAICAKLGASPDLSCPNWRGVSQIKQNYFQNGTASANYGSNFALGASASAAVATGDHDLVAEMYRQSELVWDDASTKSGGLTDAERYILSTPKYFHGWFRVLGLLTNSGCLAPPDDMKPVANMRVYMAVDKTFAYEGDLLTYTVSYRNYGSVAASGVSITTTLDNNYQFVSATNGGILAGNSITWAVGNVPGFTTGNLTTTQGSMKFTVRVKSLATAVISCLKSTITSTNSPAFTSNEYPNNASYTMERNCVDLLKDRVLSVKKSADRTIVNGGDIVNFKIEFENKTGSNLWLNGGRDKVLLSYANFAPTQAYNFYQFYRIWHTGHEAYINLGNYRVSYFINDPVAIGAYNATTNPNGWSTFVDNQNDLDKYGYNPTSLPINQQLKFTYQKIPWGTDANGSWNQRVVTQFANVLSAPSTHIYDKLDSEYLLHKGVKGPGFTRTRFLANPAADLTTRIADDWSYSSAANNGALDGQAQRFFPISPSYTNFATSFAPTVVNNYSKDVCDANVANFGKVLVEEFDGYTWRRIAGNGPLPGRETYNVLIVDSIPIELTFGAFTNATTLGVTATYTALTGNSKYSGVIRWTVPVMLTGEKGLLTYTASTKTVSCPVADKNFVNAAWISSSVDSPDSSALAMKVSCTPAPPTAPAETSLKKTANKTNAQVGDAITYTLTFTNKDGSTGQWNGSSTLATEWRAAGTAAVPNPKTAGTTISFDQNANNNSGPYGLEHLKVHGKNGWVESTIDPTNASTLSYFFRHTTGTPGNSNFLGIRLEITPNIQGPNTANLVVYNNNTAHSTMNNISYGGTSDPIKIKMELIDDKLYIWTGDFTGAPLKVVTGLTNLNEGYTGMYANGSQQSITAWKGHFDSAFDLVMTDAIPSSLSVNAATISHSGTLAAGTITWPTIAGPILANVVTTRTFDAAVNTCNNFITNIGKASVYGVSNIQSQVNVTCGTTPVCVPPATPTLDNIILCQGATSPSVPTPATSGNNYIWYTAATGTTRVTAPDFTTTSGIVRTYYVSESTPTNGGCESARKIFTFTVNPTPTAPTSPTISPICAGNTATLNKTGTATGNFYWYTGTTGGSPNTNPFTTPVLSSNTNYYLVDSVANGCKSTRTLVVVTVNPTPTAPTAPTISPICSGNTATLNKTGTATGSFYWYGTIAGGTPKANPFTTPILNATTTYYLIDSTANCKSARTPVEVTVNPKPAALFTYTPASGITTATSVTFNNTNAGASTYVWKIDGVQENTNPTFSKTFATNKNYIVRLIATSANGCKDSTEQTVSVGVVPCTPPATPTISDVNVCEGTTAQTVPTPSTANNTYVWYTSASGTSPATPDYGTGTAITRTYFVAERTPLNGGCESTVRDEVKVTIHPKPTVQFNFTPATGITTATSVTFNNTSTGAASSSWKIDGVLESANPTTFNKTFATNKTYVVRLIATTANSCKDSLERDVIVGVVPCTPPATPIISDVNVCQGDATPTIPTPNTANNTYVWYTSSSGTSPVTPDFGTNNTTPRTYFVAERTPLNGGCESTVRDEVKVAINALPTPTLTTPFSQCGGNVDLKTLSSAGNIFYTDTLPTAIALTNTVVATSGVFYVQTTSAQNCKSKFASGKLDVTIKAAPVADVNPKTAPYCGTGGSTLTATNAGTGATYEWFLGTSSMGTPTTNNTLNNALAGSYTVKTTLDGCSTTSTVPAVVSVVTAIVPKIKIKANSLDTCLGSAMVVNIFSQDNGTVQWFEEGVAQGTGNQHVFNLTKTTKIKVVLTSSESCANPKTAADSVTINTKPLVAPIVSISPDAQNVCEGTSVNFSASPADGLNYEWYVGTVRQVASTNTFSTNTLKNNDIVRVVYASPAVCANPKTAEASVPMTIKPKLAPSLKLKPTSTQVCAGEEVTFEIGVQENQGTSPTYSWFVNNTSFAAPASASSITIPISATTNVHAVVTSSEACVSSPTANSDTLKVSVNTGVTPLVEITPIELKLCGTNTGSFSISKIEGEGTTPVYQWLLNGNPIANANSSSLNISTLVDGDKIALAFSSSSTCKLKAGDTSNVANILIKTKPVATINQPVTNGNTYSTSLKTVDIQAVGANGVWEKSGLGTLSTTSGAATVLAQNTVGTTEVRWVVSDASGICPSDTARVFVKYVDGPFANAGADAEKCESETIELKGQGSAIGTWASLTTGASLTGTGSDVAVSQKIVGVNQFSYCVTDNSVTPIQKICDTVEITVRPTIIPTISILRTLTSVDNCVGDLAEFTATASAGTITWSNGSTGTTGTYTDWNNNDQVIATITNNDACAIPKSVTSNTIVLNGTAKQDIDLEAAIPALIDGTFCFGKEVDLVAVAGSDLVKYQWLAADRSMLSSDASYSFSATESTTLVLKTTAPAGCYTNAGTSKERTINIEVEAPITITNLGYTDDSLDLQSICVGNKGIFTVMGTASQYKWFVNGTEDAALVDATVSIANLQNGDSVRVEAQSLAGCPVRAKASIAVVVDKMPRKGLVTGTEPVYHCAGKDTVARTTETQKYTYTWKSGNTVLSTDSILKTRSESKGTVTIQNGACVVNFPFEVRETAFGIKLNASPAENFEPGEALDLSTSVSGNKYDRNIVYQWSPTAILATPNAANTKANPTETVFVKVMATSPEGCMAKDSLELKKRNKLFIPNALTPESGDQNAAWNISGTENYPDLDIKVFNRWGVLVHSQTGYTAPWDGNLNGKPLPAGTYYFVIKHRTLDKPLVGDLTIVR